MKNYMFILFFVLIPSVIFAAGSTQSGRDTNSVTVEAGRFINPAMVDAYEYINDYDFPYEINKNEDLSVFVKLEKGRVLSIGDN